MTVIEKVDTTTPPGKVRAIAVFPLDNDTQVFAGDFDSLDTARTSCAGMKIFPHLCTYFSMTQGTCCHDRQARNLLRRFLVFIYLPVLIFPLVEHSETVYCCDP